MFSFSIVYILPVRLKVIDGIQLQRILILRASFNASVSLTITHICATSLPVHQIPVTYDPFQGHYTSTWSQP